MTIILICSLIRSLLALLIGPLVLKFKLRPISQTLLPCHGSDGTWQPPQMSPPCHVLAGHLDSFLSTFLTFSLSILFIMVRSATAKAAKSPKKSHKKSGSTEGKKTGRVRKKTAAALASEAQQSEASSDEIEESVADPAIPRAPGRVVWDKYPARTERLLDHLDAHPDIAIKLFGDSTKVAKSEGRFKLTAKSNKTTGYLQVADGVFSIDEDSAVRSDFAANPNKYAKAVDNYITNT